METTEYYHIWYATEERALSSSKKIVYDDKGVLIFKPNDFYFEFRGKNLTIKSNKVIEIDLSRQQLPWKSYLSVASITIAFMTVKYQSIIYALILTTIGCLIGIILFWYTSKWIKIVYKDEAGILQTAYFADGNFRGYSGLLGGTKRIYNSMINQID